MAIHMLTVVVLPAIADADLQPLQLKTEPPVCVEEGGSHKSGIEVLWWSHRTRYNRASGGGGGGEKAFHFVCWKLYLQLLTQIHSLSNSSLGLLRT